MSSQIGKIIRILDTRTVIINLGSDQGININTIFKVYASPESIIDPFQQDSTLGSIILIKARLKANQVFDKFTIASTKWSEASFKFMETSISNISSLMESKEIDMGELNVLPEEIKPWKAISEEPVRIGDTVEAEVLSMPSKPLLKRSKKSEKRKRTLSLSKKK
jgi:hypothetical protein